MKDTSLTALKYITEPATTADSDLYKGYLIFLHHIEMELLLLFIEFKSNIMFKALCHTKEKMYYHRPSTEPTITCRHKIP